MSNQFHSAHVPCFAYLMDGDQYCALCVREHFGLEDHDKAHDPKLKRPNTDDHNVPLDSKDRSGDPIIRISDLHQASQMMCCKCKTPAIPEWAVEMFQKVTIAPEEELEKCDFVVSIPVALCKTRHPDATDVPCSTCGVICNLSPSSPKKLKVICMKCMVESAKDIAEKQNNEGTITE